MRMNVLLDECLPKRLRNDLPSHNVKTVPEMGWANFDNGVLLGRAQEQFEVFVTVDKNLQFQQNIPNFSLAVVVLVAHRNSYAFLSPLMPALLLQLEDVRPGRVYRVAA